MSKFKEYLEQNSSSIMKNAYNVGEKEMEKKAPSKSTLYKKEQAQIKQKTQQLLKQINDLNEDLTIKLHVNYGFKEGSIMDLKLKDLIKSYEEILKLPLTKKTWG